MHSWISSEICLSSVTLNFLFLLLCCAWCFPSRVLYTFLLLNLVFSLDFFHFIFFFIFCFCWLHSFHVRYKNLSLNHFLNRFCFKVCLCLLQLLLQLRSPSLPLSPSVSLTFSLCVCRWLSTQSQSVAQSPQSQLCNITCVPQFFPPKATKLKLN